MGMSDMHRGAHFCPLEEDACQLIRSSVPAALALLKALLIVFKHAVQRMTAAGGGKDEESFKNDANGALCYERPDGHAALSGRSSSPSDERCRLYLALSGSGSTR